jgi:hypothetical protein
MHKGQKVKNVKTHYEFGNDFMKMCFEHKTRMKVDYRIKNIKKCFYYIDCDFIMKHFLS